MKYFKRNMREGDKEDTKLVGAEIPTNIFQYMNLFCVVDGISKTSIVRPLIENWADEAKKKFPEKKLIELAIDKGYFSWSNRGSKRNSFASVIKVQQLELKRKGLPDSVIVKIIKGIIDAKSKADKKS